jgi:hypothetical protein
MPHRILIAAAATGALLALAAGGPALAHHAFAAEFDGNAPVHLKGTITKMEWINPHAWMHIMVSDPGKPPQEWMVEGGTPNTLFRNGLTKESIKPGVEVIVRGYQAKDKRCLPACKANGRDITFLDGRKVFMGSSGTGAPRDGSDPTEK